MIEVKRDMKKIEYDIPDLDRITRMKYDWTPVQLYAYINDLYKGLIVRDKEIEELKEEIAKIGVPK